MSQSLQTQLERALHANSTRYECSGYESDEIPETYAAISLTEPLLNALIAVACAAQTYIDDSSYENESPLESALTQLRALVASEGE